MANITVLDSTGTTQTLATAVNGGIQTPIHALSDTSGNAVSVTGNALNINLPNALPAGTNTIGSIKIIGNLGGVFDAVANGSTATPANAILIGGSDGTHLQSLATDTSGRAKVCVFGNASAALDGVITAATAPANGLAILSVNQTTAPSLSAGQSVAQQCDYAGSVFVKPYRRSQSAGAAATITASTSPVNLLTGQGANIFADLGTLVITPVAGATANTGYTITLSDGTANYIFDLFTGSLATVTDSPTPISVSFNPPLPATTANTAWTVTSSSATPTTHFVASFVLQKAS